MIATARLNTATEAGRDALETIKFFGRDSAWSIGYKAVKARQVGAVRELLDVELYEISPVLHGAHPDARLLVDEVKSAARGRKRTPVAASVPTTGSRRWALS